MTSSLQAAIEVSLGKQAGRLGWPAHVAVRWACRQNTNSNKYIHFQLGAGAALQVGTLIELDGFAVPCSQRAGEASC